MTAVMQSHISNVMGHFKGKCYAWDVVNEALEDNGSYRNNPFLKALGDSYFALSFKFAAAADPSAKLYYNDCKHPFPFPFTVNRGGGLLTLEGRQPRIFPRQSRRRRAHRQARASCGRAHPWGWTASTHDGRPHAFSRKPHMDAEQIRRARSRRSLHGAGRAYQAAPFQRQLSPGTSEGIRSHCGVVSRCPAMCRHYGMGIRG